MKVQSLIQLLSSLGEANNLNQAVEEIERTLAVYGFDYYRLVQQYGNRQSADSAVLAQKWPAAWLQQYAEKNYAKNDPLMRHLPTVDRPFRWRGVLSKLNDGVRYSRVNKLIKEAARYGLEDGYVFPIHGSHGIIGRFTIAGKPIDLTQLEISLFDAAAKAAFWTITELNNAEPPKHPREISEAWLTPRQAEILNYLAEGMTSIEIAERLHISTHTVDWYMTGLQGKLNARNRQHAVALAFRHGLL
ncbi:helix-turn-helix transcriptional regulator [Oryzifoliimicrobium ureilyticus]|uniref:helix-turn-helix transcriptional regulator n=1 Tax=Oryzifoliimicrobium ureilyticus TaxID=3113724 RepID=UPI00307653BB